MLDPREDPGQEATGEGTDWGRRGEGYESVEPVGEEGARSRKEVQSDNRSYRKTDVPRGPLTRSTPGQSRPESRASPRATAVGNLGFPEAPSLVWRLSPTLSSKGGVGAGMPALAEQFQTSSDLLSWP